MTAIIHAHMMMLIYQGPPITPHDLSEILGVSSRIVGDYLAELKKRRLVYVAEWVRAGASSFLLPAYLWGPGKSNVPRPKPLTTAERTKNWRRRQKLQQTTRALCFLPEPTTTRQEAHHEQRSPHGVGPVSGPAA